jgi:serine/threonine-protein kinase
MGLSDVGNALLECPSREVLSEFNRGHLSDPEYDSVASHISSCSRCVEVLRELYERTADDSLIVDLKECYRDHPYPDVLDETVSATSMAVGRQLGRHEMVGKTVGQYRIDEVIGWGGMGVVYRARQLPLERDVALKMISAGYHASPKHLKRFEVEVKAVSRLKHVNVVLVFDVGDHEGLPFYSMELVEGGSLKDKLAAQGPFEPREAATLIATLARAIHAAHEKRVIHRDLKPGNILFALDGTPKVADFGLAKLMDDESGEQNRLTLTADMLGTAPYMAPEQAAGRKTDFTTDVYALGAILYESLTGHAPFEGGSSARTIQLVQSTEVEPPSRHRSGIPFWLESICLKCLEKPPGRRYESAQALADDLDRWLQNERPREAPGRIRRFSRWLRRHVALLLVSLTLASGVTAAYLNSEDRALRSIEASLKSGAKTQLIGVTGGPRWLKSVVGSSQSGVEKDKDGAFSVQSFGASLLLLAPDPKMDRYRISAQIRHDDSDVFGGVGLFVAYASCPTDGPELHYFARISFNGVRWQDLEDRKSMPEDFKQRLNLTPEPLKNVPEIVAELSVDRTLGPGPSRPVGLARGAPFEALGTNSGVWHDVILEVTPDQVTGYLDGKKFSVPDIQQETALNVFYSPDGVPAERPVGVEVRPVFDPRGGLGLYVRGGQASFRSVLVTPLNDARP